MVRAVAMPAGIRKMWSGYSRGITCGLGNSPPKNRNASHSPTNGIDSTTEYAMRRPVPESRSSGSE
jgi:hypothetical protein